MRKEALKGARSWRPSTSKRSFSTTLVVVVARLISPPPQAWSSMFPRHPRGFFDEILWNPHHRNRRRNVHIHFQSPLKPLIGSFSNRFPTVIDQLTVNGSAKVKLLISVHKWSSSPVIQKWVNGDNIRVLHHLPSVHQSKLGADWHISSVTFSPGNENPPKNSQIVRHFTFWFVIESCFGLSPSAVSGQK